jgi:hypothetical protein
MIGSKLLAGTGVTMTAKETARREGKGEDGRARTREFSSLASNALPVGGLPLCTSHGHTEPARVSIGQRG